MGLFDKFKKKMMIGKMLIWETQIFIKVKLVSHLVHLH